MVEWPSNRPRIQGLRSQEFIKGLTYHPTEMFWSSHRDSNADSGIRSPTVCPLAYGSEMVGEVGLEPTTAFGMMVYQTIVLNQLHHSPMKRKRSDLNTSSDASFLRTPQNPLLLTFKLLKILRTEYTGNRQSVWKGEKELNLLSVRLQA